MRIPKHAFTGRSRFAGLILGAGLLLAPTLSAAAGDDAKYKKNYEEKLSLDFIEYGGWITDYDKAKATAKAEGKVLFVYFSRSYSP